MGTVTTTLLPLGARLRERRRAQGMDTATVAATLGVSQPTLSDWENGKSKPRDEYLDGVAAFLGLSRAEVVLIRAGEDPAQLRGKVDGIEDRLAAVEAEVRRLRLVDPARPDTE